MALDRDEVKHAVLGEPVPDQELLDCLERAEYGVLALADDSTAYSFPTSFGYDDNVTKIYFLFLFDESSRKRRLIPKTDTASFTAAQSELPDKWESVHISGDIAPVSSNNEFDAYHALAETAEFPAFFTFPDSLDPEDLENNLFTLLVDTKQARRATPREE